MRTLPLSEVNTRLSQLIEKGRKVLIPSAPPDLAITWAPRSSNSSGSPFRRWSIKRARR